MTEPYTHPYFRTVEFPQPRRAGWIESFLAETYGKRRIIATDYSWIPVWKWRGITYWGKEIKRAC